MVWVVVFIVVCWFVCVLKFRFVGCILVVFVGSCGSVWGVGGFFGSLWGSLGVVVDRCGSLWVVVDRCGIVVGRLWAVVGCWGSLWVAVGRRGSVGVLWGPFWIV